MTNQFVDNILNRGSVPARLRHSIARPELMERLSSKIKAAMQEQEKNWVLVHGAPGVGKTRLVADTLRSNPEFATHLFRKIVWISDHSTNESGLFSLLSDIMVAVTPVKDLVSLQEKLQSKTANENAIYLQKLTVEAVSAEPKTLLIVDGIWQTRCVNALSELPCPIVFTSCASDIFANNGHKLSSEGFLHLGKSEEFTEDDVRALAAKYELHVDWLQASNLKINAGSNFALLGKFFEASKADSFMLSRLSSKELARPLDGFKYSSSYPFRSMGEAVALLLQQLNKTLARRFDVCAVFPADEWIHFEVFKLMWPLDLPGCPEETEIFTEVMGDMSALVAKSLVEKNKKTEKYFPTHLIYPIVHSYLLKQNLLLQPDDVMESAKTLNSRLSHEVAIPPSTSTCQLRREVLRDFYERNQKKIEALMYVSCTKQISPPEELITSAPRKSTLWDWIKHSFFFWY